MHLCSSSDILSFERLNDFEHVFRLVRRLRNTSRNRESIESLIIRNINIIKFVVVVVVVVKTHDLTKQKKAKCVRKIPWSKLKKEDNDTCICSLAYRFGIKKKNRKNKIIGKKVCVKVKGF